ncbi:hypothetical protein IJ674_00580 [bacterium]|nr:hypothetical protein [bacterium]
MFDPNGNEISALYQMIQMRNSERIVKFKTESIDSALGYLQWHIRRYKRGLLLEIAILKKIYDWRTKSVKYSYE